MKIRLQMILILGLEEYNSTYTLKLPFANWEVHFRVTVKFQLKNMYTSFTLLG